MKLNISAKELLALHNILYERFEACYEYGKEYEETDPRAVTNEQLRQLYNRVRACLVASLTNKMVDPLDSWVEGQQRKIGRLKDTGDDIKKEDHDLASELPAPGAPVILSAEDTDVLPDTYPRKGPPPPRMPSGGKFRGHRR